MAPPPPPPPPPPSPYDDPVPRGWKLVQGTLRVSISLQCAGAAIAHLRTSIDSPVVEFLRTAYELPQATLGSIDQLAACLLAVAALLTLLRPFWPMLAVLTLYFGAVAAAPAAGDDVLPAFEQSLRVFAPLVLLLIDFWPPPLRFSIGRATVSLGLLRLATVVTLVAQGLVVLDECGHPGVWTERLERAAEHLPQLNSAGEWIVPVLAAIAAIDLALAFNLLAARSRPLTLLLVLWQGAIAVLPLAADGVAAGPDCLVQAASAGAPLALFFFWLFAVKEQPPIIIPGHA